MMTQASYLVAHACVIVRRVSQTTSFEMSFSRTVLNDTCVPILRSNPCARCWIMHPLCETYVVNSVAWTCVSLMLKRTQMDECSGCPNEMIDIWTSSQQMCSSKWRWSMCPETWDDIRMHKLCCWERRWQ